MTLRQKAYTYGAINGLALGVILGSPKETIPWIISGVLCTVSVVILFTGWTE